MYDKLPTLVQINSMYHQNTAFCDTRTRFGTNDVNDVFKLSFPAKQEVSVAYTNVPVKTYLDYFFNLSVCGTILCMVV